MLATMSHLSLVHADLLSATITELREASLEALAAIRLVIFHDISLTAQLLVAVEAGKVLHVPTSFLSLCAFVCKDYLQKQNNR